MLMGLANVLSLVSGYVSTVPAELVSTIKYIGPLSRKGMSRSSAAVS